MIESFRHKGLKRFFEIGDGRGLNSEHAKRIRTILTVLNSTEDLSELSLQSYRLHQLEGDRRGVWSVTVRANWRITFRFEDGAASDIDLEDYH